MIPLSNLRGSRMARADTIIVCSLPFANNAMHSLAGGAANCLLRVFFFYVEKHLGLVLLSVIRSSGVSVLEGL